MTPILNKFIRYYRMIRINYYYSNISSILRVNQHSIEQVCLNNLIYCMSWGDLFYPR